METLSNTDQTNQVKALERRVSDCKAEIKRLGIFIEKQALEIRRLRLTDGTFKC
jgi:hypothetical protein